MTVIPTSCSASDQQNLPSRIDLENTFTQLISSIKEYTPELDDTQLRRAFKIARQAHASQKRESGEPFVIHPLAVAQILTEYEAGEDTIIAALLHDTIEDSEQVTFESVAVMFGNTVASLVEGVTKIQTLLPEQSETQCPAALKRQREIETVRKIFQKTKQDVRVILIKLADRLHNMQTLGSKKNADRQRRKAEETYTIFVQVAARLGIWKMKRELEFLCFPYLFPESDDYIRKYAEICKEQRSNILDEAIDVLRQRDMSGLISQVKPYHRGIVALKKKFDRKKKLALNDNLTIWVSTKTEEECYLLLCLVHNIWAKRGSDEDSINTPRDNGYRAYHTEVVTPRGHVLQFRIMTDEMWQQNWYGVTYRYFQKKEQTVVDFLGAFEKLSNNTLGQSEAFLEAATTDLLDSRIKVHANGKSMNIPSSATALDFVFLTFAKQALAVERIFVNDHEVPFDYQLSEEDLIEVHFSQGPTLHFHWLYWVSTATAKIAIQEALCSWPEDEKREAGRQILQEELDVYNVGGVKSFLKGHRVVIQERFQIADMSELTVAILEGQIKAYEVIALVFAEKRKSFWRRLFEKIGKGVEKLLRRDRKHDQVRLQIEGVLHNYMDEIYAIHERCHRRGIEIKSSNIMLHKVLKTFDVSLDCDVSDREELHNFLRSLETRPNIREIIPIFSFQRRRLYMFGLMTVFFVATSLLALVL